MYNDGMKRTVTSLLLSILLNVIGCFVNLIYFNSNSKLLFAFSSDNGALQRGFGWISEHSSLVVDGETCLMHTRSFSLGNLLLFIAAGFVVFYLVLTLTDALKSKKS